MKSLIQIAAVALALSAGTAAQALEDAASAAASAAEVKAGTVLKSADGKRLGRIERVVTGADGSAQQVSVIYDSRFVYIPASTISAGEKGLVTSLTKAEVRKLK